MNVWKMFQLHGAVSLNSREELNKRKRFLKKNRKKKRKRAIAMPTNKP